ncbi:MAG TPA: hypothetical protein PKD10_05180 [Paracoccaceae bacterium]|nr:hypothetical protein [Paracoccaceae bacterium]HMO70085.1 hypothetical protein [Paracoccaceae bacterium]
MPIVIKRSTIITDPRQLEPGPDPVFARGRPIVSAFSVANAADDSSGSMYHLVDLPSDCSLDHVTAFQVQNWGFAAVRIGTRSSIAALVSVARADANVHVPMAIFDARWAKPLWQQLGLSADPRGMIGLWAHAIAGATGAGSMLCHIGYRFR